METCSVILTSCSVVHIVHSTHNGKDGKYKLVCSQMLRKQHLKSRCRIHICTKTITHTCTHTIAMFKKHNSVPVSGQVIYVYTRCTSPKVDVHLCWLVLESFTLSTLQGHAETRVLARYRHRLPSVW